ncbi:hypothetical protein [Bizionia arctica]|nr:hypothetical protein [Bizionia arctica]
MKTIVESKNAQQPYLYFVHHRKKASMANTLVLAIQAYVKLLLWFYFDT